MKRLFDIVAATLALIIFAPFIAVGIFIVRWTSPGPGIFRQVRVGRRGKHFCCYKMRTMFYGSPSVPTHEATVSLITPTGQFLRRTKIDELPQLWNVLKGEMSFVGPRPCLPSQDRLVSERQALGVLEARPGITGLAQVRGIDMSDPVRLARIDAEYLETATFLGDLLIILKTVSGGGQGDKVGI
ncbi:sugar transferase [Mesorhizobium sp. UC22_110]|uniref:sugar transferase n=1 Tax=unclassified Mesorhizobium TaxID=325217 RepID=UPI00366D5EC6